MLVCKVRHNEKGLAFVGELEFRPLALPADNFIIKATIISFLFLLLFFF
jgi:hypothetical protein